MGDYTVERDDPRGCGSAYLLRGPKLAWPYRIPTGATEVTCTLADVVPMTTHADIGDPDCLVVHDDGTIDLALASEPPPPPPTNIVRLDAPDIPEGVHLIRDVSDQRPFGDFTPGRYAWLLDDIKPVDPPVPCKGRQGLWEWERTA